MKAIVGSILTGLVIFIGIIIGVMCLEKVPAGYTGVVYQVSGGIQEETLSQGWHMVSPMKKVTLYSVGLEQSYLTAGKQGDSKDDESFTASSSEGKAVTIDMTFTYQFDPLRVSEVFTRFKGQSGNEVRDSFLKPNIISWTKEIIAKYKVSDILGAERANINTAITEYLATKSAPYGIIVSNASLINLEVDAETSEAISQKITAQQKQETSSIENQTAIAKAEADAKVKTTAAQAEADALLIQAQAQADANKLLSESLTEELIESQKIDKWNGDVPMVQGSDGSVIVDTRDVIGQ